MLFSRDIPDLRKNLSNVFGWRTKRKIVVIESDDWGSIRTRSIADYHAMLKKGLELDCSNFTRYDSLESDSDLENLFDILSKQRDSNGRSPVITPMCVVANPDFKRIEEAGFSEYFFEPLSETWKSYPNCDRVPSLWIEGIRNRLFVPQLHGREHLNVNGWMKGLKEGHAALQIAFNHHSIGASWFKGERIPEYLAAFHPDTKEDIKQYDLIIRDACILFKDLTGYNAQYFIAPNKPEPKSMEKALANIGIRFLARYKIQHYPLGDNHFKIQFNWLGKRNNLGQIYLTRNCSFEPSGSISSDIVGNCLREIDIAFKWEKPAIISSHRVNYIGSVVPENALNGLRQLKNLLSKIRDRWPAVEYMTSVELGNEIGISTTSNFDSILL